MYPRTYREKYWGAIGSAIFAVGMDSWLLLSACGLMAGMSVVLLRFAPIDVLNMSRDWMAIVVALGGFYGYGAAMTVNELFDTSQPQAVQVPIASKYVVTGKGSGSFFKLAPWGDETVQRSYRPSLALYNQARIGDAVCAELHTGALGMRWYQLRDSCR